MNHIKLKTLPTKSTPKKNGNSTWEPDNDEKKHVIATESLQTTENYKTSTTHRDRSYNVIKQTKLFKQLLTLTYETITSQK